MKFTLIETQKDIIARDLEIVEQCKTGECSVKDFTAKLEYILENCSESLPQRSKFSNMLTIVKSLPVDKVSCTF